MSRNAVMAAEHSCDDVVTATVNEDSSAGTYSQHVDGLKDRLASIVARQ